MTQYTLQYVQSNLGRILNEQESGVLGTLELVKKAGAPTVAKLMKYSAYVAANISGSADLALVPQIQLQCGPMTNPATNGLYKLTKTTSDVVAIPDGTVHASLQVTQGAGGVLWTAIKGGTQGNAVTVTYVDPGVDTALTTAAIVGDDVTVTLSYALGAVTATAASVAAAATASAPVSARVSAVATGTPATLAAAYAQTPLANGANQPTGVQKFKAVGIYRKRQHSHSALIAPSVTPRSVLISQTHASFIGV